MDYVCLFRGDVLGKEDPPSYLAPNPNAFPWLRIAMSLAAIVSANGFCRSFLLSFGESSNLDHAPVFFPDGVIPSPPPVDNRRRYFLSRETLVSSLACALAAPGTAPFPEGSGPFLFSVPGSSARFFPFFLFRNGSLN